MHTVQKAVPSSLPSAHVGTPSQTNPIGMHWPLPPLHLNSSSPQDHS